ncbi:hypothetical protein FRB95_000692, partial [Tulasnella sp. JGI-2019a]
LSDVVFQEHAQEDTHNDSNNDSSSLFSPSSSNISYTSQKSPELQVEDIVEGIDDAKAALGFDHQQLKDAHNEVMHDEHISEQQ